MNPSTALRRPDRRGFILATSLLVLTLLTVMLTAAFILVSAEFRTTDNAASSARALALAEAGLEDYLSQRRALTQSATSDSVRVLMPGGYADVIASRVRAPVSGYMGIWSLKSTGYPDDPLQTGTPRSKRTVARLAQLFPGNLPARAALTALNGVHVIGTTATNPVDGNNFAGTAFTGCALPPNPMDDTVGLAVVTGGYSQGGTPGPSGTTSIEYFNLSALYDSTHINWVALKDTTTVNFAPDFLLPPGPLPTPTGSTTNLNFFVYYAPDNYVLPGNGGSWGSMPRRGVLVAGKDLTISDEVHWDGVILVGGRLIIQPSAEYIIHGQVITGLNLMLSSPPSIPKDTLVRDGSGGTHRITWSWCYVNLSADALSGFAPLRRAWTDGWALY